MDRVAARRVQRRRGPATVMTEEGESSHRSDWSPVLCAAVFALVAVVATTGLVSARIDSDGRYPPLGPLELGVCVAVEDRFLPDLAIDVDARFSSRSCRIVSGSVRLCSDGVDPSASDHAQRIALAAERVCYELRCPIDTTSVEAPHAARREKSTICFPLSGDPSASDDADDAIDPDRSPSDAAQPDTLDDGGRAVAAACGDANGSGSITSNDALLALQTAVGATTCSVAFIDVNGDGNATATDALAVLRAAVGLAVTLVCPTDTDADCVPDVIELAVGTDPGNPDSNGNTLGDGDEDADFDGLSTCDELKLCTDPVSSDTDGDGLTDGDEIEQFDTDPTDADSDDDGFDDRDEILAASDPNDSAIVPFTVVSTSPLDGETGVAVSRETVIRLSNALTETALVDETTIWAEFAGLRLNAMRHVSADRRRITLFYAEPLPASARIRVFVDGDRLVDVDGLAIDADGDGLAGGLGSIEFDTLTLTVVPGTSVCGRVFASGLAEGDMGASVNVPLAGVRISVDGMENQLQTFTDDMGNFRLEPAPAGRFFVHIDGQTATNPDIPAGSYYPFVGKPFTSMPGQEVVIGDVFLPLIVDHTLQPVSDGDDTTIGFPPEVVSEYPEFADVSITVPAGSLFSDDGSTGGLVGLAPVPPDRLPGALPEGLNFPVVITVQTSGPSNFDIPAPVCLPNLPDPVTDQVLVPGAKTALWSFDHDTGRWSIIGPATVTGDGSLACTDAGIGIRAPGWHGLQPGAGASGGPVGGGGGGGDGGCDSSDVGSTCTSPPGYDPSNSYNGCGPHNLPFGNDIPGDPFIPDDPMITPLPPPIFPVISPPCAGGAQSFFEACKNHDICYSTCGSDKDVCDMNISKDARKACACYLDTLDLISHAKCLKLADLYELAVSKLGGDAHSSAQRDKCDCPDPCAPDEEDGEGEDVTFADPNAPGRVLTIPEDERLTGAHHFAILNLDRGEVVLRGTTGSNGIAHEQLLLEPDTNYQQILLNAATLDEGWVNFRTGAPGTDTPIPVTFVGTPISWDMDGDGLHDNGEIVMGTQIFDEDTDGDGILDGAEVQQGLDPLGELVAVTGIIASIDTPGTAVDVDAFDDLTAIADSGGGVSLFNVFNGMDPTIVGQIDTPGTARSVAIDGDVLAVADGAAGLTLLDISFPDEPRIVHQILFDAAATAVAAASGVVYVGLEGGAEQVVTVDSATGLVSGAADVGSAVLDLAIERETLYVLTTDDIRSFDITAVFLDPLASAQTSPLSPERITGRKRLFVGGGLAYATASEGFDVFDVNAPADILKVGDASTAGFFSFKHIVADGSGLGVAAAGVNPYDDGTDDVSLYDLTDPSITTSLITQFGTPGVARALSIYNGLAYVADGDAGMQVVSYLPYDDQRMPPTVALTSNFSEGVAEEASLMRVTALVTDDVQVRNVELYVDGRKIETDGNFPFEFRFDTPQIADQPSFTMQARASDTGGNAAFSELLTVMLTDDATPPRVLRVAPRSNSRTFVDDPVNAIAVVFDEPIDPATIGASTFTLVDLGADGTVGTTDDAPVSAAGYEYEGSTRTARMLLAVPLPIGTYRATVTPGIADDLGNSLAQAFEWPFEVSAGVKWDGGGDGVSWFDPLNWELDQAPVDGDRVIIDVPGDLDIQYASGSVALSSLLCSESITLTSGTLAISQASYINGSLTLAGGRLDVAGETVVGPFTWTDGDIGGGGTLTAASGLSIAGTDIKFLLEGVTVIAASSSSWSDGHVSAREGSVLRVPVGATLDVAGDVQWSAFNLPASNLDIEGALLRSAGSGDLAINGPSTFAGTVDIDAGRLLLDDVHEVSGSIDMGAGTMLEIAGDVTMTAASQLTGAGALSCSSGSSSIAGAYTLSGMLSVGACTLTVSTDPLTLGSYSQSGGRFDVPGDSSVAGSMAWTGGTIGGGGRLTATNGVTLAGSIKNVRDATTLVAESDSTWSAGRFWVWDGSVVRFPDGATLDVTGDVSWEGFSSPESLAFDGTLRRSAGDGDLVLDGDSTFNGAIEVHTGRLVLDATHTINGSIDVAAGSTLVLDGDVSMSESSQLTGNGGLTCIFETSSIAGSYALGGPVVIEGGTLTISSALVSLASYSQSGGNFNVTGDVTVTGAMTWTAGDIGGGGTLTAASGLSLSGAADKFLYDGVTVVASSTSSWSAGRLVGSEASVFRVPGGAILDVTGDVKWSQFLAPPANFDVDGTLLRSAGSGDLAFAGAVTNDGTISVLTGRINATSTYVQSASGTLSLAITGTGASDGGRFAGDSVTLAGTFEAAVGGGYAPQLGDLITAMTYSSRTGMFSSYTGFDLGGGLRFQQSFDSDSMDLEVVSP